MLKDVIATGKTIDEAVEKACQQLGVSKDKCSIETINEPKKGFLGFGSVEAKVRVTVKELIRVDLSEQSSAKQQEPLQEQAELNCNADQPEAAEEIPAKKENNAEAKLEAAVVYLKSVLKQMELERVEIKTVQQSDNAVLTLEGENLGILIGRHGETLDALQYLTSLVCNRVEGSYYRITLDCGNYREKREDALKELAKKISTKVKRTGRSQMLEPMNPYERRIIHAVLSDIDGVTSKSKGDEPNRRVVIIPTNRSGKGNYHKRGHNNNNNKQQSYHRAQPERTMEQILKGELTETEKNTKLYSKIEIG